MKKSLIALAALATVGAAQAQSSVTISGNLDMGYQSFGAQDAGGVLDKTFTGVANGSSTSTIAISGVEDIGGGRKVSFQFGNDLAAGANNTATSGLTLAGQSFLAFEQAGVGTLRFGNLNTQQLVASGVSQPFATAIGSGYSGNFGRQSYIGVNGTVAAANSTAGVAANGQFAVAGNGTAASGARTVRASNQIAFETASFAGFSAVYSHIAKNGDTGETAPTNGAEEIAIKYSGNGLNVVASQFTWSAGNLATTGLANNEKVKHTLVGANYALTKDLTVMGGYGTTKSSVAANADSANMNVAARYQVTPVVAVMANYLTVNDKLAANADRRLLGLGADYSLSKRSVAYARYEQGDHNRSDAAVGKFTNYGVGLRHSF